MTADSASRLATAIDLHQRGDLAAAESLYRAVLDQDPANFTATHLLGLLKRQQGDSEAALRFLAEALKGNPRSAIAHMNLGLVLLDLQRAEEALGHFQIALVLKPDDRDALLSRATALRILHRQEEALAVLDKALASQGEFADGLVNRGIVLQDLQRPREALGCFDRALSLQPDFPEASFQRGLLRQGQGHHQAALADYQSALAARPDWVAALVNQASVLHLTLRTEEALGSLQRALSLDPDLPEGLLNCGIVLRELGRPAAALTQLEKLLALHPAHIEAHLNRGRALRDLQRPAEALACFEATLVLQPDHPDALMERGNALLDLGRASAALASLDQALQLRPEDPVALSNRGNAVLKLARPQEALGDYARALALRPDHPEALMNRGTALLVLKRPAEALASYELALSLRPAWVEALMNRGTALVALQRMDEALASYDRALALQPDHVEALTNRGTALHRLGRNLEALASYEAALALKPGHLNAHSNKIFVLDYLPQLGFEEHQLERRKFFLAQAQTFGNVVVPHGNDPDLSRRLILGYVSADFRRHSAASCFRPVLFNHDHQAFKVICYSGTLVEDDWTQSFRAAADLWRTTAGLSDDELAAQIRADAVDILIDLSGHSEGNRLLVFARKPAPIQVTAWGHGGGTGLPMIDYLFTDPVHIPAWARPMFAEHACDLPCNITFDPPDYAPAVAELPARSHGWVTFGSLNRFVKITPALLDLWARILNQVPASRLLLKDGALDDPQLRAQLQARFGGHEIAPERLLLRGVSDHEAHLAAYNEVDIVLDPFPQNGGITTWEALWMGAPVIAMPGNKPSSRISASILQALGLGEWIAEDEQAYLELAVQKAADLEALACFRQGIRARIAASPAGNPQAYTRAVEASYRSMWTRWLNR